MSEEWKVVGIKPDLLAYPRRGLNSGAWILNSALSTLNFPIASWRLVPSALKSEASRADGGLARGKSG